MKILVVGDGPRDQVALPKLVCKILKGDAQTRYDDWHHVRVPKQKGTIYARKLKYFVRRAIADDFDALALVVDTDKAQPRDKLRMLREGRDDDRKKTPPFPTAVGEANPHFEVWLLDDSVAVRSALRLPNDHHIPNALKVDYPKQTLSNLIEESEVSYAQISYALGSIADHLVVERCVHSKQTGFAIFVGEVEHEILPSTASESDPTQLGRHSGRENE